MLETFKGTPYDTGLDQNLLLRSLTTSDLTEMSAWLTAC